ncbi:GIDE domain-containing protein [Halobium salinum]|uniref:RING-type E3 ubiquitin transferase n=1 Tax=Halobium salinum TaxID=1364940 RepID=A0ABD5PBZ8_9EURY|nr:GIDE domain-containing protein [Halobium salinum]
MSRFVPSPPAFVPTLISSPPLSSSPPLPSSPLDSLLAAGSLLSLPPHQSLQSLPFGLFTLFGLVFAAVGLFFAARALRSSWLGVQLLRARPQSVLSLSEGLGEQVCLVGTAQAVPGGEALAGPFSGRPAVVAGYEVEELRSRYDANTKTHRRTWETVDEGWAGVPFVLDDGSAGVRVDPAAATYVVAVDERTRVAGGRRPPEHIRSFVERNERVDSEDGTFRLGPFELATGDDRRYTERRIEPGDEVCVVGTPAFARGDVGDVNAEIPEGDPFVVADAPPGVAGRRLLLGSVLPLVLGLVFAAVGLVFAFGVGLGGEFGAGF